MAFVLYAELGVGGKEVKMYMMSEQIVGLLVGISLVLGSAARLIWSIRRKR
jgi:hypothetical protein